MSYVNSPRETPLFYAMDANKIKFTNIGDLSILVMTGTVTITNKHGQELTYTEGQEPRLSRNEGNLVDEITVDATSGTANVIFYGSLGNVETIV